MKNHKIRAEVVIDIPKKYVLVEKNELLELKQKAEPEWNSGLKWLSNQTGIKSPAQLKEKILYPFREQLEDFVGYPKSNGGRWRFNTYYMKKWLRENFDKVIK